MNFFIQNHRVTSATKRFFRDFENQNINPKIIAETNLDRLSEVARKSELYLSVQIENIRAIDSRSLRVLSAIGFVTSIGLTLSRYFLDEGFETLSVGSLNFSLSAYVYLVIVFSVVGFVTSLIIIASSKILLPGNQGIVLMKDLSNMYSQHEEAVDYIFALSEAIFVNESLIKQNGRYLFVASWCLAMNFIIVSLAVAGIL